ncbi:MAG TPA: hypothetical protein VL118_06390, partial [Luteimonas sp.]|nr:hypothetical protein [Luteimonas sp.]
ASPMAFASYPSDTAALSAASGIPAVRRLAWFNYGFQKADVRDGTLVLSDIRMGAPPDYSFSFAVARRDGDAWRAIDPPYDVERLQMRKALRAIARRLRDGDPVKVEVGKKPERAPAQRE